jgi:hypothetical protein
MKVSIGERMKKRGEEAASSVQKDEKASKLPEMVQVNVEGDLALVAPGSAEPKTKLASMESVQFIDQHIIDGPMVEKRGLASQVDIVNDENLISRAVNQRNIYLEKRSAYRSHNGTTLVSGRTKSNSNQVSKFAHQHDPSLGQLPASLIRASQRQHHVGGSIITSKETQQSASNNPIIRNSFVKKDPYQKISLQFNKRSSESGGLLLRPMTAPYNNASLSKLKKNQRSVQYLRNPFGLK